MEAWADPAGWRQEGAWFVRKGGNLVIYGSKAPAGRVLFTVLRKKSFRWSGVRWFVGNPETGNYAQFRIDKSSLHWTPVAANSPDKEKKLAAHEVDNNTYTVEVAIEGGVVRHRIYDGATLKLAHEWASTGIDLNSIRFGFVIPRGDEVWVSNFRFIPAQ
jgi:hypothetical protein